MVTRHEFGGDWTTQKLLKVRKYLDAYTTALKNQPFDTWYIDAFAGTGYIHERDAASNDAMLPFDEIEEAGGESRAYREGSARIALGIQHAFQRYVFVEQNREHSDALRALKREFPDLAGRIEIVSEDCNLYIQRLCSRTWPADRRAVLFMDPYGMNVDWATIEVVAATQAIDLWVLFPHAIGVNRLLKRRGEIPSAWEARLTSIFGTDEWRTRFYQRSAQTDLWSNDTLEKTATLQSITEFYLDRLRSCFANVYRRPYILRNSKGSPLFILCFAIGNPNQKAVSLATQIARNILEDA